MTSAQRRDELEVQLKEACDAISFGVLANTIHYDDELNEKRENNNGTSNSTNNYEISTKCYVSAANRLKALTVGVKCVRELLKEFNECSTKSIAEQLDQMVPMLNKDAPADAKEKLVNVRAELNAKSLQEMCKLQTESKELRLADVVCDNNNNNSNTNNNLTNSAVIEKRLQPLQQLLAQIREVRECKGYEYERELQVKKTHCFALASPTKEELQQRQQHQQVYTSDSPSFSSSPSSSPSSSSTLRNKLPNTNITNNNNLNQDHIPRLIKRLQQSVEEIYDLLMNSFAKSASSNAVIKGVAGWPVVLLKIVNEVLQSTPIHLVTERHREQLKRIKFDVEELQHAQEEAVNDGDMQKSEELYFAEAALLEAMKPHFDELEKVLELYKEVHVQKPLTHLKEFNNAFQTTLTAASNKESNMRNKLRKDMELLEAKRAEVEALRKVQRTNLALYDNEWNKIFDDNVRQQTACLKAMEELEKRLTNLAQEQHFLVTDRVAKWNNERHCEEDALTFHSFTEKREAQLQESLTNTQATLESIKIMEAAINFSCGHFQYYLENVIDESVDETLTGVRKERLEQFRDLYLTLGDLQFKKARHAEEINNKIEYYTLQQEIAMDTLNPKAKEYSQAKRKWQEIQDEVNHQLQQIEVRSEQRLLEFKPTEEQLHNAGVDFTHPQEELAQRNMQRTQKLIEYKKLMEEKCKNEQEDRRKRKQEQQSEEYEEELEEEEHVLQERKRAFGQNADHALLLEHEKMSDELAMLTHNRQSSHNTNSHLAQYELPLSSTNGLLHNSLKGAAATMPPHTSLKSLTSETFSAKEMKSKNGARNRQGENGNANGAVNSSTKRTKMEQQNV